MITLNSVMDEKVINYMDYVIIYMNFGAEIFFPKKYPYRGNLMWEIDCAHSRSVKMLP